MGTERITSSPLEGRLWSLAWPIVALGWLRTATLVVDAGFVAKLGPAPFAALGAAAFLAWVVDQLSELSGLGTQSRVARATGASGTAGLDRVVVDGVVVALIVAAILALAAPQVAEAYVWALDLPPNQAEAQQVRAFLTALLQGALGGALLSAVNGVLRGLGWTRTALGVTVVALALNALLDPVLIWGLGPIPALGIAGAAWATQIGAGVAAAVGGTLLVRALGLRVVGPVWQGVREVVAVGGPPTVTGVGFSLVYVVLGRLITQLGPEHVSALGLGHRLEGFPYLTGVGIMVAAGTLVGQAVGAGDLDGARAVLRGADRFVVRLMLFWAVAAWLGVELAYQLVVDDPAVVAAGGVYLRVQALVWVGMGMELLYEGAFGGVGRTVPVFWIGTTLTVARIPLAYFLVESLGAGPVGVWAAIAASTAAKGVGLRWWFWHRDPVGTGAA